jgi:hypothetical protein
MTHDAVPGPLGVVHVLGSAVPRDRADEGGGAALFLAGTGFRSTEKVRTF